MKAVILAAGVGSRLSPLTLFMPKPMAPVVNKPVMEHLVELLARNGIEDIYANLHYLPDQIERYFGDGRRWGVHMTYSLERELLGTAGAVRRMAAYLGDTFVVMMGDAITDLNLEAVIAFHRERKAQATIVLHHVEDTTGFGVAQIDEAGHIMGFQEKPRPEEAISRLASMGVYILEPSVLDLIPADQPYDFARQLFPRLLKESGSFYGYEADCYWSDVGSLAEYRRAQSAVLRGLVRDVLIPGQQVSAGVWLGRNAVVHPQARLLPPVVLGDNCQVRAEAVIGPDSVLGNNVVVDEGAEVVGSIVLENTYVGRLVNVQEAIANRNCLINVPAAASVFVSDSFLLGEVSEGSLGKALTQALERVVALLLLIASLPLWLVALLLARLGGPGPLLIHEERATTDPRARQEPGRSGWRAVRICRFRADRSRKGSVKFFCTRMAKLVLCVFLLI